MKLSIFWFRRDLRLEDNAGFSAALQSPYPVLPLFIYDQHILTRLEDQDDARVTFIFETIQRMYVKLKEAGGTVLALYGKPIDVWKKVLSDYDVAEVYTNHDYEVYGIQRDEEVNALLKEKQIPFYTYKDQVIFEKREILNGSGNPYTVFTPYSKKWRSQLTDKDLQQASCEKYFKNLYSPAVRSLPSLKEIGFVYSKQRFPSSVIDKKIIETYDKTRDYPSQEGTTRLGMHLRFGTISIREAVSKALKWNDTWLNELIWRDFFMMILSNFPQVEHHAFRPAYDRIQWRDDEGEFRKWCEGRTGYPIVDAGMRQLNEIGFMHNRVRMIAGSFLVKHLLIDWRWGEAYFARKLLDFEQASNNGNWQWVAGSGCDATPYFRIFNPVTQTKKFDKAQAYIKNWVPEIDTEDYPAPMVEHEFARERALRVYRAALKGINLE